jgi:hypothetical protein
MKLKTDDDVINAMLVLHEQDKEWYGQGINAFVSCWHKAVEVYGDTVEK